MKRLPKYFFLFLFIIPFSLFSQNKKVKKDFIKEMEKEEKEGVWEFYDRIDTLHQVYDFTNDTLFYINGFPPYINIDYNGKDTVRDTLDSPAILIGGFPLQAEIYLRTFVYPPLAVEDGIQGKVYTTFAIDSAGE